MSINEGEAKTRELRQLQDLMDATLAADCDFHLLCCGEKLLLDDQSFEI